ATFYSERAILPIRICRFGHVRSKLRLCLLRQKTPRLGLSAMNRSMKKLLLAGVAAPFLATGAAHAEMSSEKCSCEGRRCNLACISEPTPEVVVALRKQFPNLEEKDIQVFDDRQLAGWPSPYHVAFSLMAALVIAKLDRLSRNLAFIATLMD